MRRIASGLALCFLLASCAAPSVQNSNISNRNFNAAPANMNAAVTATGSELTQLEPTIRVTEPARNASVKSPLTVSGQASGWYFEASFGVRVVDANGKQLYQGAVMATDDWMTTAYVPFKATFPYEKPTARTGTVIFEKANPSGLPENDERFEVPVTFADANQ